MKRRRYKRYRTGRKRGGQRYHIGRKKRIRKKARKMDEFEKFMTLNRTIGLNKDELIESFERTSPEELKKELVEQKRQKHSGLDDWMLGKLSSKQFKKQVRTKLKKVETPEDLEAVQGWLKEKGLKRGHLKKDNLKVFEEAIKMNTKKKIGKELSRSKIF